MSGFNRYFRFLRGTLKPLNNHKANIYSKAAKHEIPVGEQAFAMVTFFVAMLGPAAWILGHVEQYKAR